MTPLILNVDGSLAGLESVPEIDLTEWQEAIRFGCSSATWQSFRAHLDARLPATYGTVCMGSGDFHHISHLLLKRLETREPFDVVVLDNHPDNMRFPFGIHCGSWVMHAARLQQVRRIHVLGITSGDIAWPHAWENYLLPLWRGKLCYWSIGVDTGWAGRLGLGKGFRSCRSAEEMLDTFLAELPINIPGAAYLSIDKDVLAPDVARTNWDQGCLGLDSVLRLIEGLDGKLIGSDITGEISQHHYQTRWKRWLSAADQQAAVPSGALPAWQAQQMAVNRQLLGWLQAASR